MGGRSCPAHFGCGSPGLLPRRRPPGGKERGRMGPPPGPGMGSGRDVGLALAIQRPQGGGCAKNPWAETSCRMPGDPHRVAFWPRGSGGRAICWLPLRRFQDQRVNAARSPARLLWRWRLRNLRGRTTVTSRLNFDRNRPNAHSTATYGKRRQARGLTTRGDVR
jgi:hypothetical protein